MIVDEPVSFDWGRVFGTLSVSCALANNSKAVYYASKKVSRVAITDWSSFSSLLRYKIAWPPEGMILRGQLAGPRHKLSHRPKEWLLVPFHRFLPIGVLWLKHAQRLIHSTQRLLYLSVCGRKSYGCCGVVLWFYKEIIDDTTKTQNRSSLCHLSRLRRYWHRKHIRTLNFAALTPIPGLR